MIEKFETYIDRIKRRLNPKVVSVIFFCIFGFFLVFGMEMTNNFRRQKQLVQDEYNRGMYEMISYIKNFDLQLSKLQIISDKPLITTTLADIWRQSNLAKENLANLPILQDNMKNTSKYLTQLSDYSYYLMKKVSKNENITEKEYEEIANLSKSSNELLSISNNIYMQLNTGRLKWDEVEKVGNEELDKEVSVTNISDIAKTFQDYEGLIYDGAFSDHIINLKPKYLGENIVTDIESKENLIKIFGEENIENIEYIGENNNELELYEFNVKLKNIQNTRYIAMTKKGGKLYLMISDKDVKEIKLTSEKAIKIGKEFLGNMGIDNIEDTYYIITENLITINYAAVQDNVLMYPDLVKVKIALDDGEVCSVETLGYTFNHEKRTNLKSNTTIKEAKAKLNSKIEVQSERLAIIPTESKKEILVYEFKGSINDKDYIIYINALTLREEKVLMIIDTPNGTLTM